MEMAALYSTEVALKTESGSSLGLEFGIDEGSEDGIDAWWR